MSNIRFYTQPLQVTVSTGRSVVKVYAEGPHVVRVMAGGAAGSPAPSAGFTFSQPTPAATWTVNHGLGYRPLVAVSDPGGNLVVPHVIHLSANTLLIQFNSPTAGTARIN